MTMPVPTQAWVEAQGGVFWGWFPWPIPHEGAARFFAFRHGRDYPEDHMRWDCHVGDKVIVFSLHSGSWTKKSSEPDTIPEGEYSGVTSKAKYTTKQVKRRARKQAAQ